MSRGRRPGRRRWLILLGAAIGGLHLWLADALWPDAIGSGRDAAVRRMTVSFVRELRPEVPLLAPRTAALAPPPATGARPRSALAAAAPGMVPSVPAPPPLPAASAPDLLQLADVPASPASAASADSAAPGASAATAVADASAAPAADQAAPTSPPVAQPGVRQAAAAALPASAAAFEWPPSTRLSYTLQGYYRGGVSGQAQVEWLQRDGRYQVHLEVSVGPAAAPFLARRMSSEGRVGPEGLRPRRYEEETRMLWRAPRRQVIELEDARVVLPAGTSMARPSGVQDSASQFVQMTYLFTLDPARLVPGHRIELPLALPRRVEPWIYEVLGAETLQLPVGELKTFHVQPRRAPRDGDLSAEFWIAPSLQYLPVRILIRQDAETWVDLTLERLPQQAAPR
jgi:Protein of unknown function (DUF3108)